MCWQCGVGGFLKGDAGKENGDEDGVEDEEK